MPEKLTITYARPEYEHIIIWIKERPGKYFFFDPDQLIGLKVKGELVKKRVRTWLEIKK